MKVAVRLNRKQPEPMGARIRSHREELLKQIEREDANNPMIITRRFANLVDRFEETLNLENQDLGVRILHSHLKGEHDFCSPYESKDLVLWVPREDGRNTVRWLRFQGVVLTTNNACELSPASKIYDDFCEEKRKTVLDPYVTVLEEETPEPEAPVFFQKDPNETRPQLDPDVEVVKLLRDAVDEKGPCKNSKFVAIHVRIEPVSSRKRPIPYEYSSLESDESHSNVLLLDRQTKIAYLLEPTDKTSKTISQELINQIFSHFLKQIGYEFKGDQTNCRTESHLGLCRYVGASMITYAFGKFFEDPETRKIRLGANSRLTMPVVKTEIIKILRRLLLTPARRVERIEKKMEAERRKKDEDVVMSDGSSSDPSSPSQSSESQSSPSEPSPSQSSPSEPSPSELNTAEYGPRKTRRRTRNEPYTDYR